MTEMWQPANSPQARTAAGSGAASGGPIVSGSSSGGFALSTLPTSAASPGPSAELALPSISLPKGGGAIRGIGEKLTVGQATGTATLSVPVFTSPGRSGFGPALSLAYDPGTGNGPFGLGWRLSVPSVTRKTSMGLPLYEDADDSDVFILSGIEDLVPLLKQNGDSWEPDVGPDPSGAYTVRRYRPRVISSSEGMASVLAHSSSSAAARRRSLLRSRSSRYACRSGRQDTSVRKWSQPADGEMITVEAHDIGRRPPHLVLGGGDDLTQVGGDAVPGTWHSTPCKRRLVNGPGPWMWCPRPAQQQRPAPRGPAGGDG
jgi:hypothetical protein